MIGLRAKPGTYAPRLWWIWLVVPLVVGTAGAAALGVHSYLAGRLHTADHKDVADLDLLKATFTVLAFAGVLLGGIYAYRKQRLAEGDARRGDADLYSNRFTAAAEQLGHDRPATRMAGVYAMARLADDWEDQRQTCIDVLCAYLRLPADESASKEEREIRRTVIRVMRNHLRPSSAWPAWIPERLHKRFDRAEKPGLWSGCNFSFERATLEKGDLSGALFAGKSAVTFHGVHFGPEKFDFSGVRFAGRGVWFTKAEFKGPVSFAGAEFSAEIVDFDGASESDGGEVIFYKPKPKPTPNPHWGPFTARIEERDRLMAGATASDGQDGDGVAGPAGAH